MDTDLVKSRHSTATKGRSRALPAAMADRFLATSHRILRDLSLAEDATQQALLTVWQDLPQLRDPARFDAWWITGSSCVPATPRPTACADGRQTSGRCLPMRLQQRMGWTRSLTATSSSAAFVDFHSITERWWSCTTTSTCRSTRWPTSSASRPGRLHLDFITRCVGCARRSMPTHARRRRRLRNERRSRRHPHRSVVAEGGPVPRTLTAYSISFSISWTRPHSAMPDGGWRGGTRR